MPPALRDLVLAGLLLTRLPMPRLNSDAFEDEARAAWAYPIVGLAIGLLALLVGALARLIGLGDVAAAGLMLATLVITTGALHEDGLADTFDGLWGGQDRARRLEIMRDSRIGTYGVLALVLVTGLRWVALATVAPIAVVAAAMASRSAMVAVMAALPHARTDGQSARVGAPGGPVVALALGLGAAGTLIFVGLPGLLALLATALVVAGLAAIARRKIGGQTGDILGAVQVLSETALLLALIP